MDRYSANRFRIGSLLVGILLLASGVLWGWVFWLAIGLKSFPFEGFAAVAWFVVLYAGMPGVLIWLGSQSLRNIFSFPKRHSPESVTIWFLEKIFNAPTVDMPWPILFEAVSFGPNSAAEKEHLANWWMECFERTRRQMLIDASLDAFQSGYPEFHLTKVSPQKSTGDGSYVEVVARVKCWSAKEALRSIGMRITFRAINVGGKWMLTSDAPECSYIE